jgi:hypothetical protein
MTTGRGIGCFMQYDWCSDVTIYESCADTVLFLLYTLSAYAFQLSKVEYNWGTSNYLSMSRFSDVGNKMIALCVFSIYKIHFEYSAQPAMYLVGLGTVGVFIAFRFFFYVKYHRLMINFAEVLRGQVLFILAVLCAER